MFQLYRSSLVMAALIALISGPILSPRSIAFGGDRNITTEKVFRSNSDSRIAIPDDDSGGPNPCEQALKPHGNANGLNKRCNPVGAGGAAKGDFNGDGFADLAIGVPNESVNGQKEAGGVNIIYGSANGLTSASDQFMSPSIWGRGSNSNGHFGWALASGDFNGDGNSDLAISEPHGHEGPSWNDPLGRDFGQVYIIYGASTGLSLPGAVLARLYGSFGSALAWGDFDGDGRADLAVGTPNDTYISAPFPRAGYVQVFYGSRFGISDSDSQVFKEGTGDTIGNEIQIGIGGFPEEDDLFGEVLAATRKGTYDDLVIGVPHEDVGLSNPKKDAGVVYVIKGTSSGLQDNGQSQIFTQGQDGLQGSPQTEDMFGRSLAIGDFNGDGRDDLAIGVPLEDLANSNAGAVQIIFGAASGSDVFTTAGNKFISQAVIPGVAVEYNDRMGWALAANDFDRDGRDDLAIGVPGEDVGLIFDAGLVTVLYGSSTGPSTSRYQHFTQDSAGIPGECEAYDQFGYALSSWNYGYGLEADLAIGVPYEDLPNAPDSGSVNVIYGSPTGLSATTYPAQIWNQDSPNIKGVAQSFDHFGQALY